MDDVTLPTVADNDSGSCSIPHCFGNRPLWRVNVWRNFVSADGSNLSWQGSSAWCYDKGKPSQRDRRQLFSHATRTWGPAAWVAIWHEAPWMTASDRHRNYGARDRTTMPLKCRHLLNKPVCHGTVNIGTVPAAVMTENESRAHGTVLLECATMMTSRDMWKGAWHTVLRDLLEARPRVLQIITKQAVTVRGRPNQVLVKIICENYVAEPVKDNMYVFVLMCCMLCILF